MGTIQKILDLLLKSSEDKAAKLDASYEEHTQWLSNEFGTFANIISHLSLRCNQTLQLQILFDHPNL